MDPKTAWEPYRPTAQFPWTPALAAHLLRRATFGFSRAQLDQAISSGPQQTVDRLFAAPPSLASFNAQIDALAAPLLTSEESGSQECAQLWLYRIMNTPFPLQEKATLFWHDYFAIAGKSALMENHLRLLRRNALGRFDALLLDLSRDPATILGCGFADALFGRYTGGSSTPANASRAFTGYGVLRNRFHYQPEDHLSSISGDDAVKSALAQPNTAPYVVTRLYRWLISETTPPAGTTIKPLADAFARDFNIGRTIATILRSNLFFSSDAIRQRVKSPLEFALNLTSAFQATVAPASLYPQLANLGQRLAAPPSREGWAGGRAWLNAFTVMGRTNLAHTILAKVANYPDRRQILELLLQSDSSPQSDGAELALALAASPEFQLA
jgi:uncharacterized protein (DUF1800 family)